MSSSTSIAAPSPMLIPCRALSNGLHGSGSMRRSALKPLNVSRASASVPPQIAASSSPSRIRSAAWPIAIVLDEHAATTHERAPCRSKCCASTSTGAFEKWWWIQVGRVRSIPSVSSWK